MSRGIYMRWILVGVLGVCAVVLLYSTYRGTDATHNSNLRVVFFDVGQGDSIYIESPTGVEVLIDGGKDATVLQRLSDEMGFFDKNIDVVLATHEDKDHVGGLPDVFERYKVGMFVRTENQGESADAHVIDDLSWKEGSQIVYARRGMDFDLGGGARLEILFPDRDPTMLESNTSSIVARLVYGESEFLLTGDSPISIEDHLVVQNKESLRSDVLKLGHHGSRTSTGDLYIDAVKPQFAIVSAGKDNSYGHPHKEVIDRLNSAHIQILNIADEGSIVFETDGKELRRK